MAQVKPFAALRPCPEQAAAVAALPYDVMSTEEARVMAANNPRSFLHIDKAEIDLAPDVSPYDAAVYAKAQENLQRLEQEGVFIRDDRPCFYIYRLTVQGHSQTGLAACLSVEEYEQGIVRKHEFTRADKEQDRIEHILACRAHTGPIFVTYRDEAGARALMKDWTKAHAPEYDFDADNGVQHTLWVVDEPDTIAALVEAFAQIPRLYIADGHHRSAAAAAVAQRMKAENAESAEASYNVFLSVIFPYDELSIMDYNRLVRDLNGLTGEAFISVLSEDFDIKESETPVKPEETYVYGLYMGGQWYRLTYKHEAPGDAVEGLAVSVLQERVLAPVLNITDPKTDKRIDFVGGIRGSEGLTQRVDSGEMVAAFSLCATSMEELMAVADAERIMPPKSTWFEPKLLSGLLIHKF